MKRTVKKIISRHYFSKKFILKEFPELENDSLNYKVISVLSDFLGIPSAWFYLDWKEVKRFLPLLRPIFVKVNRLPFWIGAISLFPFVFVEKERWNETTFRHEFIHFRQQLELGVILFYILYLLDFLWLRIKAIFIGQKEKGNFHSGFWAYYHIIFEQEAFTKQTDAHYWRFRKPFAWLTKSYLYA